MNAYDTATEKTAEIVHTALGDAVDDLMFADLIDRIVDANAEVFVDSTLALFGLTVDDLERIGRNAAA